MKSTFNVLFAALLAGLALAAPAPAATPLCTPDAGWPSNDSARAARVLELVNQHRAGLGLRALTTSATLTDAAVWKARHMARYEYLGHDDPAPPLARTVAQRFADCGYRAGWGENIAYGYQTPEAVVQAWLASPGHKANIENASFVATGIGVADSASSGSFWAQTFGTQGDAPPPKAPPAACASGGRIERARCHLRQLTLERRRRGWSWARIKASPEWRAYRLLGGS